MFTHLSLFIPASSLQFVKIVLIRLPANKYFLSYYAKRFCKISHFSQKLVLRKEAKTMRNFVKKQNFRQCRKYFAKEIMRKFLKKNENYPNFCAKFSHLFFSYGIFFSRSKCEKRENFCKKFQENDFPISLVTL